MSTPGHGPSPMAFSPVRTIGVEADVRLSDYRNRAPVRARQDLSARGCSDRQACALWLMFEQQRVDNILSLMFNRRYKEPRR